MQGKLIVIEGIDGSGKTEQVENLLTVLKSENIPCASLKFPVWDSLSGRLIKTCEEEKLDISTAEGQGLLYLLNFAEVIKEVKSELAKGKVVVLHRYTLSICVHGGMAQENKEARLKFYKWLENTAYNVFGLPKADLNIILDTSESLAHKLIRSLHKPTEKQSLQYLEKARKIYLELAGLMPATRLVEYFKNGELENSENIQAQIWELVRRIALKKQ